MGGVTAKTYYMVIKYENSVDRSNYAFLIIVS